MFFQAVLNNDSCINFHISGYKTYKAPMIMETTTTNRLNSTNFIDKNTSDETLGKLVSMVAISGLVLVIMIVIAVILYCHSTHQCCCESKCTKYNSPSNCCSKLFGIRQSEKTLHKSNTSIEPTKSDHSPGEGTSSVSIDGPGSTHSNIGNGKVSYIYMWYYRKNIIICFAPY